jgi:8-oxo-dGTP diphosphatase
MIDVVCAVIEDVEGRVLACLRPAGKHLGGLWEFPGGKVEDGETPQTALARELREELGIEVEVLGELVPVPWQYERGAIRLLPFHCRITGGEAVPHEHERLLWCAYHELAKLTWAPADLPVLEQLRLREADFQSGSDQTAQIGGQS